MIAVWGCLAALLLDLFDRFERHYAHDLTVGELLPVRRIAWGIVAGVRWERDERYFVARLPSYSWEYNPYRDDFGMAQRVLLWTSYFGWQVRFIHP